MIRVEEKYDVHAKCPHCEKELRTVYTQKMETTFGVRFLYFCSYCKKVLGVTHRKGFWMG